MCDSLLPVGHGTRLPRPGNKDVRGGGPWWGLASVCVVLPTLGIRCRVVASRDTGSSLPGSFHADTPRSFPQLVPGMRSPWEAGGPLCGFSLLPRSSCGSGHWSAGLVCTSPNTPINVPLFQPVDRICNLQSKSS